MNFELKPWQIAAVDQASTAIKDITDKIDELAPMVVDAHGDRQKSLLVIASSVKIALAGNVAPELIIAEMALRQHEKSANE